MASNEKLVTKAVPFTFVLAFFSLAVISPGRAQTSPTDGAYLLKTAARARTQRCFLRSNVSHRLRTPRP